MKNQMVIDHNVATAVKNFLENYAEIYGLPSPGRSVNRITQSVIFLAGLEEESNLKSLKYDAFRKL